MNAYQSTPPAAGEAAHTPFPVLRIPLNDPHHIQTSTGETIAFVSPDHAPFIVRACNSHAALVAALETAHAQIEQIRNIQRPGVTLPDVQAGIRAAIGGAQ